MLTADPRVVSDARVVPQGADILCPVCETLVQVVLAGGRHCGPVAADLLGRMVSADTSLASLVSATLARPLPSPAFPEEDEALADDHRDTEADGGEDDGNGGSDLSPQALSPP